MCTTDTVFVPFCVSDDNNQRRLWPYSQKVIQALFFCACYSAWNPTTTSCWQLLQDHTCISHLWYVTGNDAGDCIHRKENTAHMHGILILDAVASFVIEQISFIVKPTLPLTWCYKTFPFHNCMLCNYYGNPITDEFTSKLLTFSFMLLNNYKTNYLKLELSND